MQVKGTLLDIGSHAYQRQHYQMPSKSRLTPTQGWEHNLTPVITYRLFTLDSLSKLQQQYEIS